MFTPSVRNGQGAFLLKGGIALAQDSLHLLSRFPQRKTTLQKQQFRQEVQGFFKELGYAATEEPGSFGCCNLVAGNPESATYLLTAHYDSSTGNNTAGILALLEIAEAIPEGCRNRVCFVLFDRTVMGLTGGRAYRRTHKAATDKQLVLNLELPACGDRIAFVPTKELKKDRKKLTDLYRACGYFGKKSLLVQEKKVNAFPSEQRFFPYAAGIHVLKKGKLGWNTVKSHSCEIPEPTNINILRAALTSFLCCDAGK